MVKNIYIVNYKQLLSNMISPQSIGRKFTLNLSHLANTFSPAS